MQLAALRGADVNATCGPRIAARVLTYCARTTVDYWDTNWSASARIVAGTHPRPLGRPTVSHRQSTAPVVGDTPVEHHEVCSDG